MLDEFSIHVCYSVGPIAQSVEQRTFNPWVDGSSPSGPTQILQILIATPSQESLYYLTMRLLPQKKSLIATAILISLLLATPAHAALKNIAGTSCKKAGTSQNSSGKSYLCTLVGKKLVWKIKAAPAPIPASPTWAQIDAEKAAAAAKVGPSWAEIEAQKAAVAAKAAEELRVKVEAEAKAAAEAKAKQDAEAKAAAEAKAKQDAEDLKKEKPLVAGLTIGELLWSEEFKGSKGSAVNSNSWTTRTCHRVPSMGGGACFNEEVQFYSIDAVELDGTQEGSAVISTKRPTSSVPLGACLTRTCPFVSGRFDTHGKVSFQYGFIEARIKMPAGSGNHPAFWMLGDNINQVGWPTTGEIDITEIHSNDPNVTTAAINYSTSYAPNSCCGNHKYTVSALNVGADVSAGFHTYAVAWLPDSVSFYVDNRLISTTTPQTLGGYWSFNDKFFLILNNAVNSAFSGSWDNLQSSTMTIDWVRSYQLNGQGQVFTK